MRSTLDHLSKKQEKWHEFRCQNVGNQNLRIRLVWLPSPPPVSCQHEMNASRYVSSAATNSGNSPHPGITHGEGQFMRLVRFLKVVEAATAGRSLSHDVRAVAAGKNNFEVGRSAISAPPTRGH